MSDGQALLLVLGLLYLSECLIWLPRNSVAFVSPNGRLWRAVLASARYGNSQGALMFMNPLPPLSAVYLGHPLPVSFSPQHACAYISQAWTPVGRPKQTGSVVRYEDMDSVNASGKNVEVNGRLFVKCPSSHMAGQVAGILEKLASLPEPGRAEELKRILAKRFDSKGIRAAIEDCAERTRRLRALCNLLLVYLFLVAPLVAWRFGVTRALIPAAAVMLLTAAAVSVLFHRSHKLLYPAAREERITSLLKMVLCAPIAIRAVDLVSRERLSAFDPLAIASVLCQRPDFGKLARRVICDLQHPIRIALPDEDAAAAERWHRTALEDTLTEFLRESGMDVSALVKPPSPQDESCQSYCPRCECQYAVPAGECRDCEGIRLMPFSNAAPASTNSK